MSREKQRAALARGTLCADTEIPVTLKIVSGPDKTSGDSHTCPFLIIVRALPYVIATYNRLLGH